MGLKPLVLILVSAYLCLGTSCKRTRSKSDIDIEFTSDTLEVAYTYWWEESGPFIGYCGEDYSLAFAGTITDLENPTHDPGPLYTSQWGTIALDRVFKINNPPSGGYENQKYFRSDCFNDLELSVGDKVLVFCYEYEGGLSIPGDKSILKIGGMDHPLVKSIKNYIDADQDPLAIQKDSTLWGAYGFNDKLAQHIRCRQNH
ncbi:hypothetical protein [Pseudozobellia thermophila]|uniref:Uncharacterized protein n=1 Tax=Pseudozobellia thermophila TaxID=192903 RepID=A0A1M6BXF7_9FLAO|nr:hypothetical protein [Pseudozobellia thermophila]SHI53469.1 hypothetical protein SAMN04488513_101570 [Pseudozobellia thermophila]